MKYLSIIFVFFLFVCEANAENNSISGYWSYGSPISNFELRLYKNGSKVQGTFCSIQQNGEKIDCNEDQSLINISGSMTNNTTMARIKGEYDHSAKGLVSLTYINENAIQWKLVSNTGELFVPIQATLVKEKGKILISQEKSYIYSDAETNFKTKSYFIRGDLIKPLKIELNKAAKVSYGKDKKNGWIKYGDYIN